MTFWELTVEVGEEDQRTVRGLTQSQSILLLDIFDSLGIAASAIEFTQDHEPTGNEQSVQGSTSTE